MEDLKNFYKTALQRDISILRTAANTLGDLAYRWPDQITVIKDLAAYLIKISEQTLAGGWKAYALKARVIPIAEVALEDTLELIAAQEAVKIKQAEASMEKANKILKEQQEKIARAKAAEVVTKALALEKAEKAEKAEKKAALEAQIAELEELS